MTNAQKITIRLSECRQKLNELLQVDDRTDEQQAELEKLTGEVQKLEPEMRAAIAAEPDPQVTTTQTEHVDPEVRERLELRGRARLGNFLLAAMRGRVLDGVEAEYSAAAFGSTLRGGYVDVPLDLFEADRPREVRADAPSTAPSTVGVMHQPVQPFLFAPSIAPTLGIEMPTVASGTFAASTITTSLTAGTKAKGGAAESTAAELRVVTSTVKRISGRLSLQAEDIAAVGVPGFESALRENLSLIMSDKFDDQAINGSGSGNNLTGLIKRLTDPDDPTAVVNWDGFNSAFADAIDGLWATTCTDVAILAGVDTYKKSVKTFRDSAGENPNDLGDVSAAAYLMKHTGGWRTNKRMPAAASNIQTGIVCRRGRMVRTAQLALWDRFSIDDVYTDSAKATRHFTAHVLCGDVVVVQPDAYDRVEFKLA